MANRNIRTANNVFWKENARPRKSTWMSIICFHCLPVRRVTKGESIGSSQSTYKISLSSVDFAFLVARERSYVLVYLSRGKRKRDVYEICRNLSKFVRIEMLGFFNKFKLELKHTHQTPFPWQK